MGKPMNKVEHAGKTESMKDMNFAELSVGSACEDMVLNNDKGEGLDDEWLTEDEDITVELQEIKKASADKFWEKMEKWEAKARTAERELKEAMLPK